MDPTHRILIVEDEAHLASVLHLNLSLEGYAPEVAPSARDAGRKLLDPLGFSLIVLDVMLPDIDGMTFCAQLRAAGNFTPVLMLTARASPADRVRGLEAGADDYLPKPFDLAELLARVRSLLRRSRWRVSEPPAAAETLTFGAVRVDFAAHTVTVAGEPVTLTRLELDLLRYLAARAGRVVSREDLLTEVWQVDRHTNTRTVDNFVARLRKLLEADPKNPRHLVSVRGTGYKFEA
jgi:DNA-binding response OmpR family regulator